MNQQHQVTMCTLNWYVKKSWSRHTVVCRAAQEAGAPHREYITGRKKTQFSHLCSSVIPYPIGTKFATEVCLARWGIYIPNLKKIAPAISEIQAAKVSFFFLRFFFFFFFSHTCKIRHKSTNACSDWA